MDYKIKYTKESILELNKALTFYRSKELDLGQRFKKSFQKIKLELKQNPKLFKQVDNNHRRAVLRSSFPYSIYYFTNKEIKTIQVARVFHQHKNQDLVEQEIKLEKLHQIKREKDQKLKQLNIK